MPDELQALLQKREIWISLGTTDYRRAAVEARNVAASVDEMFATARRALSTGHAFEMPGVTGASIDDLRAAVRTALWRGEVAASAQPAVPNEIEPDEWKDALEETIAMYQSNNGNARAALFSHTVSLIRAQKLLIPTPHVPAADARLVQRVATLKAFQPSPDFLALQEFVRRSEIERRMRALDGVGPSGWTD